MNFILITGVSTGIGFETTQYLIEKGFFVIGSVRTEKDAKRLKNIFTQNFEALVFDVCDKKTIDESVKKVETIVGSNGLKGLVNNAGMSVSGPIQHVDIEKIAYQLDVNVLGVIRVIQAFLPLLGAKLNSPFPPGKIINISSISGRFTPPFMGPYSASKHALEAISDALRRELLIFNIDVIVVQPGPILTPIWDKALNSLGNFGNTDYAPIFALSKKILAKEKKKAIPTTVVAKCIYKSLTKSNSKTRYIIASKPLLHWFLFYIIPDRWFDFFLGRKLKQVISKAQQNI